jgi:hypothetical protein
MDGYVYLATDGELFKIGKSIDPIKRTEGLASVARADGRPSEIKILHAFPCKDCLYVERFLHATWGHKRKHGEWFDLDERDVSIICEFEVGDENTIPWDPSETDYEYQLTVKIPLSVKTQFMDMMNHLKSKNRDSSAEIIMSKIVTQALREYMARQANKRGEKSVEVEISDSHRKQRVLAAVEKILNEEGY